MAHINYGVIYVDLDDVISKTTCRYVDILKRELGKTVDFENITGFNLQNSFSLTDEEYEYFFKLVHTPGIILELKPMEGAVDVLNKWRAQGYEISVVTGRLTSTYASSLEWLKKYKVPYSSFIMADKYSRSDVDKNIAVSLEDFSRMKFKIAVEDSPDMAAFISSRMNTPVILFDRPWNRNSVFPDNVQRLFSWSEIGDVLF